MAVLFSERMGGGDSLVRERKGVTACLVKVAESRHNLVVAGRRECKTALQEGVFQAGASSGLTQVSSIAQSVSRCVSGQEPKWA